jgi:hypothetical protein
MAGYFEPEPLPDEYVAQLRAARQEAWDALRQGVTADRHRIRAIRDSQAAPWPVADEREVMYRAASDNGLLSPTPTVGGSRYGRDAGRAASVPLHALSYVFGAPGRARDAVVLAAKDYNSREVLDEGEWRPFDPAIDASGPATVERYSPDAPQRALSSLMSGMAGVAYPPMGEGRPGGPRDWRADAEVLGLDPWNVFGADVLTDPLTYTTLPVGRGAKALSSMRYGGGKPAYLIDSSGDVIRRLRASPAVRVSPHLRLQ